MRIVMFIIFVLIFSVWIYVASVLRKKSIHEAAENRTFWSQLLSLGSIAMMFTYVFVLTGYFNWKLFAAFVVASEIGVILAAILNGFLGSSTSKWGAHGTLASFEVGFKNWPVVLGLLAFLVLVQVAFLVACGISYFQLPATELRPRIFQYTLSVGLAGFLLILFISVGVLVSENLDAETRTRYFIGQLGGLVYTALWVALLLWSFGVAGTGINVSIGSMPLVFSPALVGVLIGYFVLIALVPYLIGAQRAKTWRTSLLEKRKSWMTKLKDILESPSSGVYVRKLSDLKSALDKDIDDLKAKDKMVYTGIEIDENRIKPVYEQIVPAYKAARDEDPRFKHLDWLRETSAKLTEIIDYLGKLTTEPALEHGAKKWAPYLNQRGDQLSGELRQTEKTSAPGLVIWTVILTPFMSGIISKAAESLGSHFFKMPK